MSECLVIAVGLSDVAIGRIALGWIVKPMALEAAVSEGRRARYGVAFVTRAAVLGAFGRTLRSVS